MKRRNIKTLKLAAKAVLAILLFGFLFKKGLVSFDATGEALTRREYIVPGFAAMFLSSFLGVLRWQILLRVQGFHLSWKRTFQLTYIGNFFNLALPGAVSGDFVKAFYVARETEGKRGYAFGTILFDRLVGVSALVIVAATALAGLTLFFQSPHQSDLLSGARAILLTGAAGVIGFFSYLFFVKEDWDPLLTLLRLLQDRLAAFGSFVRIYEGVKHYHHHRLAVFLVIMISLLIHVLVSFACLQFGLALGAHNIFPLAVFVVVPLGLLITAVPITPAGIGTGHWAFGAFFLLLGFSGGGDIFSIYLLAQLSIGAVGGLIYLRFKSRNPVASSEMSQGLLQS